MKKTTYIQRLRLAANQLSSTMKELRDLYPVYFACGYNTGGTNPITVQDLINAGVPQISEGVPEISPEELAGLITLMEQLQNFASNQPVVSGDYATVVNKIRSDA